MNWTLSEVYNIVDGDTTIIKNTFIEDLPVNIPKYKMSGNWFYLEKDIEKLNITIEKNETGYERTLVISIFHPMMLTENLILHQPTK